ncbi:hypothetical protein HBI56_181180 [Parastagonospora nodorum]|nr:hypothetical protein HBH56_186560 [Parastagonospora nodorum]KAH3925341.1 hypothetical protein HBH54_182000 [Parastagonospora nodorum]KAH3962152.1 hypothetical protein HBH52_227120 [Parastagonospora nodorum]KAH3992058.1 hypothetical protein HBI10_222800 [Parastagonospora nodorum]KAH4009583.1 hypothetical protein HBI13_216650 [Parastagonospora nodorum]
MGSIDMTGIDPLTPEKGYHSKPDLLRVVCVGAGAAGLLVAHRMQTRMTNFELVLYEKSVFALLHILSKSGTNSSKIGIQGQLITIRTHSSKILTGQASMLTLLRFWRIFGILLRVKMCASM